MADFREEAYILEKIEITEDDIDEDDFDYKEIDDDVYILISLYIDKC